MYSNVILLVGDYVILWCDWLIAVFNVGEYRRAATEKYTSHEFFKPDNKEALVIRE